MLAHGFRLGFAPFGVNRAMQPVAQAGHGLLETGKLGLFILPTNQGHVGCKVNCSVTDPGLLLQQRFNGDSTATTAHPLNH